MPTKVPATMIATTGVTPGSYTAADITVNDSGQITSAASNSVVAGGGGSPKVTNIQITDNAYTVIDDTAVALTGGYIKITGTGFAAGCQVIIGSLVATSVSFISSTEVRAQVPAQTAGTYTVYLVNSDGGVAIRVNGLNYSSTPTWTTTSPLGNGAIDTAVSIQLVATSNSTVTFALQEGSILPAGLTLSSSGLITGTVTGITVDTTYNFTVVATDAESQDTPQAFQITINIADPYFKLTTLLLSGEQGNTVVRDSSVNNFNLSVFGDTRASSFTPSGTGWSNYFDGNGDYWTAAADTAFNFGTGDFTIECWVYPISNGLNYPTFLSSVTGWSAGASGHRFNNVGYANKFWFGLNGSGGIASGDPFIASTNTFSFNTWHHYALTRSGNTWRMFVNGALENTQTFTGAYDAGLGGLRSGWSTWDLGQGYFTGYISNLRLVKGTALYTSAFTPPTSPLTAISGTSLLTCQSNRFLDNSTNNFAITRNGDVKVVSFNPFNLTNTGVNGSAYFDGSGDYLTYSPSTSNQFGTGSFTVEAWVYTEFTPTSTNSQYIYDARTASVTSTWAFGFRLNGSGAGNPLGWFNGSSVLEGSALTLNAWNHVVYVRASGSNTGSLFLNGLRIATQTDSTNYSSTGATATIGSRFNVQEFLNGYLNSLRIVKGTAVYDPTQTSITIPTAPLTAVTNTQLLTLQYRQPHNNHGFQDASSNQVLITRNGNTTQGTFSPFSQTGWANYFDGTGDYLTVSDSNLALGTGDFTLECWINAPSGLTDKSIFEGRTNGSGTTGFTLTAITGSSIRIYSGNSALITSGAISYVNTWCHVAVVRASGTTTLYINGVSQGTTASLGNLTDSSYLIGAGKYASPPAIDAFFTGYISNFRIVKGTAVYTTAFTPPTQLLTAIANTSLLTCQSNRFIDNSTNNFTITRNGDVRVVAFSPFKPTTVWSAATNGGSAYLDGTDDYLEVPASQNWNFGTGAFTFEAWVYPELDEDNSYGIFAISRSTSNEWAWAVTTGNNWGLYWYWGNYGANQTERYTSQYPIKGQWNHIAVSRDTSFTWRFYINGILISTSVFNQNTGWDDARSFNNTGISPRIGENFKGYISDVRIIKGIALYTTSTITLPTEPLTAVTNTVLLISYTNAGIYDATSKNVLETLGSAQISTAQSKFGGSSIRFNGTTDWLQMANSTIFNLPSDYTIEFWMNPASSAPTKQGRIYSRHQNGVGVFVIQQTTTGAIRQIIQNSVGTNILLQDTTTVPVANTWTHVAVVRFGNTFTIYLDGTASASNTAAITIPTITNSPTIGVAAHNFPTLDSFYNGYLQDLRITNGYARYTANFTPPTAAFPAL